MRKQFLSLVLIISTCACLGCGNSDELKSIQEENANLKATVEDLQAKNDQLQKEIEMYVPKKSEPTSSTEVENQPIEIVSINYGYDVVTNAEIKIKNVSTKTIDAIDMACIHFDNFGRPAYYFNDSSKGNVAEKLTLQDTVKPNEVTYGLWNFYCLDLAKKGKVVVHQVHFTDGTTWVNQNFDDIIEKEKKSFEQE